MNDLCHVEIPCKDLDKAKAFYEGVFGWKIYQPEGFEGYMLYETKEGIGGGFSTTLEINSQAGILVHILVEDIPATLEAVKNHGGATVKPKTEIPEVGFWAQFTDAEGNQMALFSRK